MFNYEFYSELQNDGVSVITTPRKINFEGTAFSVAADGEDTRKANISLAGVLEQIADITPSADMLIQQKSSLWAGRTLDQVRHDMQFPQILFTTVLGTTTSATVYCMFGGGVFQTTDLYQAVMPKKVRISNLGFIVASNASSVTCTVRKNGVDTALQKSGPGGWLENTTDYVDFNGTTDYLSVSLARTGGSSMTNASIRALATFLYD